MLDKPLLRPVSPSIAAKLSPWPERIAGTVPWRRAERTGDDLNREYDRGVYADLLESWTEFARHLSPSQRHPGSALAFFDARRRVENDEFAKNGGIYGLVEAQEYLVSFSDRLYAAELNMMDAFRRTFMVERTAWARSMKPYEGVVEIGCGSGVTLIELYVRLGLSFVAGCDASHNAVTFLRRVAEELNIVGAFEVADYHEKVALRSLAPESKSWALLSVHSLMYSKYLTTDWFRELVEGPNPPTIGIHFEPMIWHDDAPFAKDCASYAELNRYNLDFLDTALAAERQGIIEIVRAEKRVLGHSAYSPTSVLMWAPPGH